MSKQKTFRVTRTFIENVKDYAAAFFEDQQEYLELLGENRPHLHEGVKERIAEAEDVYWQCVEMLKKEEE